MTEWRECALLENLATQVQENSDADTIIGITGTQYGLQWKWGHDRVYLPTPVHYWWESRHLIGIIYILNMARSKSEGSSTHSNTELYEQ